MIVTPRKKRQDPRLATARSYYRLAQKSTCSAAQALVYQRAADRLVSLVRRDRERRETR
jgi:hypothetical protein